MDELITLLEQHKQLNEEIKKKQEAMLQIRRLISEKLTGYGLLVIPFYSKWTKWEQR